MLHDISIYYRVIGLNCINRTGVPIIFELLQPINCWILLTSSVAFCTKPPTEHLANQQKILNCIVFSSIFTNLYKLTIDIYLKEERQRQTYGQKDVLQTARHLPLDAVLDVSSRNLLILLEHWGKKTITLMTLIQEQIHPTVAR